MALRRSEVGEEEKEKAGGPSVVDALPSLEKSSTPSPPVYESSMAISTSPSLLSKGSCMTSFILSFFLSMYMR